MKNSSVKWKEFLKGYWVSEEGCIYSEERLISRKDTGTLVRVGGKILKQQMNKDGYMEFSCSIHNKKVRFRTHQIVAREFIQNTENKPQVNHMDGNKKNNSVSNLEWCSNSENQIHAIKIGLRVVEFADKATSYKSPIYVYKDNELISILHGNRQLKEAGFDFRLVSAVVLGKRKSHRGCSFTRIAPPIDVETA